jgi:hypothetical protein
MSPIIRRLNENYFEMISLCNKVGWRITFTQNTTFVRNKEHGQNYFITPQYRQYGQNLHKTCQEEVRYILGCIADYIFSVCVCVLHSHSIK